MTENIKYCRDHPDRPGCLGVADLRFTMYFDDIGEAPIYWCARCGPEVNKMNDIIVKALNEGGPEFAQQFSDAIKKAKGD